MLIKKELKNIRPCECPKFTKTKLKSDKYVFSVSYNIVKLNRSGEILVLDYYDINNKELQARFFLSKESNKYITYLPKADEWSNASITYILCKLTNKLTGYYHCDIKIADKGKDLDVIQEYLDVFYERFTFMGSIFSYVSTDGITGTVDNYCQKNIRDVKQYERTNKKYIRQQQLHSLFKDEEREHYRKIQTDKRVNDYCHKYVFPHYIFFSNLNPDRTRTAKCSCCGKQFTIPNGKRIKHNQKTICPECNTPVTYCAERYATSRLDKELFMYVFKKGDYICYEINKSSRTFDRHLKPIVHHEPKYRTVDDIKNKKCLSSSMSVIYSSYDWTQFKQWIPDNECYVFSENLNDVFNMEHIDLSHLKGIPIKFMTFLSNLKAYPICEYLYKLGMYNLATCDIARKLNPNGKTAAEVLGVSKQYLPMYQKLNLTLGEHNVIKSSRKLIADEDIETLRSFNFDEHRLGMVAYLMQYMTLSKFNRYLKKQIDILRQERDFYGVRPNRQGFTIENDAITYFRDYIVALVTLDVNVNRKNMFPKNIRISHDLTTNSAKKYVKENEEKISRKACAKVSAFFEGYSKDGFTVLMPESRNDFYREGNELSHCVGRISNYYENHIDGTNCIFFIRKADEPTKAYFTAEINMEHFTVLQLYGYGDCHAPTEVSKFTKDFARWLSRQKTKLRKAG